jgi:hypothetical protein
MHWALQYAQSNGLPMSNSGKNSEAQVCIASAEELIKAHLENELPGHYGHPVRILDMHWEDIERQTSFSAQILTLQLDCSSPLKLFVKDYGSSSLPKDGLALRSNREHKLYGELLSQVALDTARYYGTVQRPGEGGRYLLIEFVEGIWLDYCDFGDWTRAAAWLGKLHGAFMNKQNELLDADYLVVHDAEYFGAMADKALKSVAQFSSDQADRLAPVLERYDEIVSIMASQPTTLVHGSFRLRNVLVTPNQSSVRICPVDWELAARGGGLHDLAFLADGFNPQKVRILLSAYVEQLGKLTRIWADSEDMAYVIHCYRLHKILKSLGDSISLKFSNVVVEEYVDMAIAVSCTLHDR